MTHLDPEDEANLDEFLRERYDAFFAEVEEEFKAGASERWDDFLKRDDVQDLAKEAEESAWMKVEEHALAEWEAKKPALIAEWSGRQKD